MVQTKMKVGFIATNQRQNYSYCSGSTKSEEWAAVQKQNKMQAHRVLWHQRHCSVRIYSTWHYGEFWLLLWCFIWNCVNNKTDCYTMTIHVPQNNTVFIKKQHGSCSITSIPTGCSPTMTALFHKMKLKMEGRCFDTFCNNECCCFVYVFQEWKRH